MTKTEAGMTDTDWMLMQRILVDAFTAGAKVDRAATPEEVKRLAEAYAKSQLVPRGDSIDTFESTKT